MDIALPLSTPCQDTDAAARAFLALPPGQDFPTAWQRALMSVRLGMAGAFFHELPALLALARQEGQGIAPITALIAELFELGFAAECLAAQQQVQAARADPLTGRLLLRYGLPVLPISRLKSLMQGLKNAVPPPQRRPPSPAADADGRHGLILLRAAGGGDIALLDRHLDRQRWRVVQFITGPLPDPSARHPADRWYRVDDLDAVAITALIERERPTILLDGAEHDPTRLALHRGPVPIQVQLSGPVSTLVPAYDWRLCDRFLTEADGSPPPDEVMAETLLPLPCPLLPLDPPTGAPQPRPRDPGRPPTFGSLAHPAKLTAPVLAAWAAILAAQPDSRLHLHHRRLDHPAARRRLLEGFLRQGIGADRLEISVADTPWDALHAIDILLDPFPFGGRSSVAQALWMGVPVLTRRGDGMLTGRRAAAWLAALGRTDWVASDETGYITTALALLRDRPALARWRLGLRPLLRQSSLTDTTAWATAVEALLSRLTSP